MSKLSKKKVGVLGAGSFGTTVATLLAENVDVLLFTRREEVRSMINDQHYHLGTQLSANIMATSSIEHICSECELIFPVIPSSSFRSTMREFSEFLYPNHILIHGTKGLDTNFGTDDILSVGKIEKEDVATMSEVILQETSVIRVGCMSGPNLAKEILAGLPAACVIASEFDEVIKKGQEALSSKRFTTFGSHDLRGAELAGALKNIIALGSGILAGLGLGKNMEALLLTRGLREMIEFGMSLGVSGQAFLGTAGIGDLIATCTSDKSRNFTFGYRFGQGEKMEDIIKTSDEVVEGVRTLKIIHHLAKNARLFLPITHILYKVIYEGFDMRKAIDWLMNFSYSSDVDFLIQK